jgi:putative solute:sodium symporter small subunit
MNRKQSYWRANLRIVIFLLLIWFLAGFVFSIFGIQWLNQFRIRNLGFGFWMAQQGSIYVFVVLVLVYALWMDKLDRRYGQGDES